MMRRSALSLAALTLFFCFAVAAGMPPATAGEAHAKSRVPRFVSLGTDKANVRTGPGVRYPVAWQFVRRGVPVEVIAEFELWRKIRDVDEAEGWVHKSLLSGRRTAVVTGEVRTFYRRPDDTRVPVFMAEPGVVVHIEQCRDGWCEADAAGLSGWTPQANLWGVYPHEVID
jgi:SH3-like domain-containing protein